MSKKLLVGIFSFLLFIPSLLRAQELHQEVQGIFRAEVLEIILEETRRVPGTDVQHIYQEMRVLILEGEKKGEELMVQNDFLKLKKGDKFFLSYLETVTGETLYSVRDVDRRSSLIFFTVLFVLVILLIGGKQGARSLISLLGSIFVIVYILLPSLLSGYPPVLTSVVLASLILTIAILTTHGFNRPAFIALFGTITSVGLTGILAYLGVTLSALSGFAVDEAVYLNFNNPGLDFQGLLLGGIIIGILGVLDDVSITQTAVVSELFHSEPEASRERIYKKALRVGREHVGALVNTLALAYTGASLPLLLLFTATESSIGLTFNQEIFATEIIRTLIGSIGLILTVPITTLLAVYFLKGYKGHIHHGHSH